MLLQLHGKPFDINLIQIYAPTSEKRYDNDVEVLYDTIRDTLQGLQSDNVNLVMGDFNAKIGQGRRTDIVGDHGLGESNERGDRLFEFCQETEMVVTNTWYKLPKRRLYTWKSPLDGGSNPEPVRNQIDYVLINKRFRNMVRSIKAYPGADIGSDHNPLVTDLTLRLKCVRSGTASKRIDVSKLRNIETRESATFDLNRKLSRIKEVNPTDVNTQWGEVKRALLETSEQHLKPSRHTKKKSWITDGIMDLMERRRLLKNRQEEYRRVQTLIKKEIRIAKQNWMKEKCEELEWLISRHDSFNIHRKNKVILEEREIKRTWQEYVAGLFEDARSDIQAGAEEPEGPVILKSELLHAITSARSGKAAGPDEIPMELIKLIDEDNIATILGLFNRIYNTGVIPEEWLISTFVTIPKKQRPKRCADFRLISLMSHMLKTFLHKIFKETIGDTKLGIKVNGIYINTIKYADDTVIIADSIGNLQLLLNRISEAGQRMGLNINTNKTKLMVFSCDSHENVLLHLDDVRIERVASIMYLGCLITEDLDSTGRLGIG
ncbi:uncharacterized protein LOC114943274 [Nylanderia fulva]|uniref:uncharacterized protein LOC114943274 n=1 Tax=Nylanderia fulva TaxID=613905 RepID=UPI0010FB6A5D|nr:uncharacterized protein LOC114943274 [Nylanderia fulva]